MYPPTNPPKTFGTFLSFLSSSAIDTSAWGSAEAVLPRQRLEGGVGKVAGADLALGTTLEVGFPCSESTLEGALFALAAVALGLEGTTWVFRFALGTDAGGVPDEDATSSSVALGVPMVPKHTHVNVRTWNKGHVQNMFWILLGCCDCDATHAICNMVLVALVILVQLDDWQRFRFSNGLTTRFKGPKNQHQELLTVINWCADHANQQFMSLIRLGVCSFQLSQLCFIFLRKKEDL